MPGACLRVHRQSPAAGFEPAGFIGSDQRLVELSRVFGKGGGFGLDFSTQAGLVDVFLQRLVHAQHSGVALGRAELNQSIIPDGCRYHRARYG